MNYVLQIFSEQQQSWMKNPIRTMEGYFKEDSDSNQFFPGFDEVADQSLSPGSHLHSRIGFPIREKESGHIRGIAWLCFPGLHHLDWSERLFICALSNYLAQAMKADGLRLAIRSFRHMLQNTCEKANLQLSQAMAKSKSFADEEIEGLPVPAGIETAVANASEVLFSVQMKAAEVKVLLDPASTETGYVPLNLQRLLRRSWSFASNFDASPDDFALRANGEKFVDSGGRLTIIFDGVSPDLKVSGALYTIATNILSNAHRYGKMPFAVWVRITNGFLHLIFGSGGFYPGDLFANPELAPPRSGGDRGVGLPLMKEVLRHEQGSARMIDINQLKAEWPVYPDELSTCATFVEILLPY